MYQLLENAYWKGLKESKPPGKKTFNSLLAISRRCTRTPIRERCFPMTKSSNSPFSAAVQAGLSVSSLVVKNWEPSQREDSQIHKTLLGNNHQYPSWTMVSATFLKPAMFAPFT